MTAAAIPPTAHLPMFEGFPYLVTRVMPTLYHHMLLPSGSPGAAAPSRCFCREDQLWLDPSPRFLGKVMTVHCRCVNDNRCAACGRLLYARKLNANFYDPRDGRIWHVPGFCCERHRCPVTPVQEGTPCA